ncbi:hypothetical protein C8R43DRAFT_901373 [Mycena crocata]|nr:hypothetical protein C8R43DRAFT_901373 [Mycena crocata]
MDPVQNSSQWVVPSTPRNQTGLGSPSTFTFTAYSPGGPLFANTTPSTPAVPSSSTSRLGTPISFTPIRTPHSGTPTISPGKRRRRDSNNENNPPTPSGGSTAKRARTGGASSRRKPRSDAEKLQITLAVIQDQGWSLGEFLYKIFEHQGRDGSRSQTHAQMVKAFLGGRGKYTPSDILTFWMASPDGVLHEHCPDWDNMYSTVTPYAEIGPIRPALTSFALQIVGDFLAHRAEKAVQASGVANILDLHLKAATWLLERIAVRKARVRAGLVAPPRKHRPASGVIIHALSDLLFCRTDRANLLPLARGILYFGCLVPVDIMAYNCRIGTMPSYSTIHNALENLSSEEAVVTSTHGSDATKAGSLLIDNVQNLDRVRDFRIGRENHMNVGMSGIWVETWDIINIHVFDLSDKRQRISYNLRATVTVDALLGLLDQLDANTTGHLEWLEVLVRCVKPLNHLRVDVKARYRSSGKLLIPLAKSNLHPLAPSGKKETIPAELKDGMLDFLEQVGQTRSKYLSRKIIVGGDGLTYAMLLQLQAYLQFHKDPFKSFEILEPQLQVWHTKWTDLIRIFQTHWGRTAGKSTNPASLGHSATKIGRAAPSNMKKVDFYPGSQLLYLVLDARMLDCWSLLLGTDDIFEYFDSLSTQKKLPNLDELLITAKTLHCTYSTARARDHAIYDTGTTSAWAKTIPKGSPWVPIDVEDSSLDKTKKKKKFSTKNKKEKATAPPCKGDFVLGQAFDFLRDGMNSRKIATAVAEGDVGCLYECLKYMVFTFSGSTHTNYMGYLLETIINLELESSPGLKEALLMCLLINLSGLAGHFEEGDYVVEFFNRLLEDVVKHKNAQFDDKFIRNVVSRNLRHIAELKVAWRTSSGMAPKSHIHSDPHTKPEMRILLNLYRKEELHSRRLGRQIDDRDTDDFAKGRTTATTSAVTDADDSDDAVNNDESEDSDDDSDPGDIYATRGSMAIVDGELVMDGRDMMEGPVDEIIPDPPSDDDDEAAEE